MRLKWEKRIALAAILLVAGLACHTTDTFLAQATATPTRTPRPTYTPTLKATDTPVPTATVVPPTATPTKKPPTLRPPTAKPPPTARPVTQPTVSPYEYHANPPSPCAHSGMTYLKGTVYQDRNDPNSRYVGAIVALGPSDGSTIYDVVKTNDYGEYTFILSEQGQPRPGTWALWLVDPSMRRKSDISAPITTNNLPAGDPNACWASGVDFWK